MILSLKKASPSPLPHRTFRASPPKSEAERRQQKTVQDAWTGLYGPTMTRKVAGSFFYSITLLASGRKLTKAAADAISVTTPLMRPSFASEISTHSSRSSRPSRSETYWESNSWCRRGGAFLCQRIYRITYNMAPLHQSFVNKILQEHETFVIYSHH